MEALGAPLFFGGIAGIALFTAAAVVSWLILRRKRQKLLRTIETEYE